MDGERRRAAPNAALRRGSGGQCAAERPGVRSARRSARSGRGAAPQGCSPRSWAPRARAGCCWVSAPPTRLASRVCPSPRPSPGFPAPFFLRSGWGPTPRLGRVVPARTLRSGLWARGLAPHGRPCSGIKGIPSSAKGGGRREHGDGMILGAVRAAESRHHEPLRQWCGELGGMHYIISLKHSCWLVPPARLR